MSGFSFSLRGSWRPALGGQCHGEVAGFPRLADMS